MFHLLPVRLPERTSTDQNAGVNDLLVTCYLCVQMGWEKASAFVCDHPVCYWTCWRKLTRVGGICSPKFGKNIFQISYKFGHFLFYYYFFIHIFSGKNVLPPSWLSSYAYGCTNTIAGTSPAVDYRESMTSTTDNIVRKPWRRCPAIWRADVRENWESWTLHWSALRIPSANLWRKLICIRTAADSIGWPTSVSLICHVWFGSR